MQDRYLYRGRRLDNGAWETGNLVVMWQNCHDEQYFITDKITGWHSPVDLFTVGQCTGLRDKNGTLIFEGDIILCYGPGGSERQVVLWCENRYQAFDFVDACNCEIIGTIHTTPELMEGNDGL